MTCSRERCGQPAEEDRTFGATMARYQQDRRRFVCAVGHSTYMGTIPAVKADRPPRPSRTLGPLDQRTACPQGHPYSAENTYRDRGGWRRCRVCNRTRMAAMTAALNTRRAAAGK